MTDLKANYIMAPMHGVDPDHSKGKGRMILEVDHELTEEDTGEGSATELTLSNGSIYPPDNEEEREEKRVADVSSVIHVFLLVVGSDLSALPTLFRPRSESCSVVQE